MGYANCQHDFASPQLMFGQLKKVHINEMVGLFVLSLQIWA